MVFNAFFNKISVISWQSVLLVEESRVHGENHLSQEYAKILQSKHSSLIVQSMNVLGFKAHNTLHPHK
jgi:hypothetical protein